jgi:hypothetical protein
VTNNNTNAEYALGELWNTILLHGEAQQLRHPNRRAFIFLRRPRETGRMRPDITNGDRPRSRRSSNVADVPRAAKRYPVTSTTRSVLCRHIFQRTMASVSHYQPLEKRSVNGLLQREALFPASLGRVLLMHVAWCFTPNGILNIRNPKSSLKKYCSGTSH